MNRGGRNKNAATYQIAISYSKTRLFRDSGNRNVAVSDKSRDSAAGEFRKGFDNERIQSFAGIAFCDVYGKRLFPFIGMRHLMVRNEGLGLGSLRCFKQGFDFRPHNVFFCFFGSAKLSEE